MMSLKIKKSNGVFSAGVFGTEQRGVCTDNGNLLLICHSVDQEPTHLHAILKPQGAQDRQLPKPSGKAD